MSKEEFIPPVNFDLVLRHKEIEPLKRVMNWLLENGSSPFQWEMIMLTSSQEYQLSIQSSWADNLIQIAKILRKYHIKDKRNKND